MGKNQWQTCVILSTWWLFKAALIHFIDIKFSQCMAVEMILKDELMTHLRMFCTRMLCEECIDIISGKKKFLNFKQINSKKLSSSNMWLKRISFFLLNFLLNKHFWGWLMSPVVYHLKKWKFSLLMRIRKHLFKNTSFLYVINISNISS